MDFINIRNNGLLILLFLFASSCNQNSKKSVIGVVSSATPEASKVGEQIFLKGGNAIDVAVAVSFALGVTEPAMSGLGGGTQVLLSLNNGKPFTINGTTLSPANTPTNIIDTLTYHRRSTIPSTVKVLDYLWRNYGSGKVTWSELLEPAIALSENGFAVGKFREKVYKQYEDKLLKSNFNMSFFLIDGNRIPIEGEIIKQPILASTLKRLAKFGANDFYTGTIAKDIIKDMETHNGWISISDLQNFPEPKEIASLETTYKGMNVFSQPPPCGGWTMLLALNLMEKLSENKKLSNTNLMEALYLAHNDRDLYPITDLVNYDSIVSVKLSKDYSEKLLRNNPISNKQKQIKESGETTHFSVVDSYGNAIAVTSSINAYFGALAASNNLGFLYNTYMDDFVFEDLNHPFAIRPNAMAYSSMSPTIVQNNDETVLVIGSPGSERIISSVAQMTAKWIENKNIEHIVKEPRIHVSNKKVYFENKKDSTIIHEEVLKSFNFKIKTPSEKLVIEKGKNAYYGGIHVIAKENGEWVGVADPRRDGVSIIAKKQLNE
jgi:gamma-glutamyltranspeptidase/glutathione hydrolase